MKLLVLLDHSEHGPENSGYPLIHQIAQDERISSIDIATRAGNENVDFFDGRQGALIVRARNQHFSYAERDVFFSTDGMVASVKDYDAIWLRLPPPIPGAFLEYLSKNFPDKYFVNQPWGIWEVGSKAFLLRIPDLCPPMKLCQTEEDVIDFCRDHAIVLKPLRSYGGKGIVRMKQGQTVVPPVEYPILGMKYLTRVKEGDKRILIANGHILGAALRLPAEDSWICNVSMGGSAVSGRINITNEERNIVNVLTPLLSAHGVYFYGIDTLMNDDGRRVLSEINVSSFGGGLLAMNEQTKRDLLKEAANQLVTVFDQKTNYARHDNTEDYGA